MAISRLGSGGYGVHPTGAFGGKGVHPHPVNEITRLGSSGYGVRRCGSFSGRSGTGPHPVSVITRISSGGYGTTRCGSFAGRIPVPPIPPETLPSGGGGILHPWIHGPFRKRTSEVEVVVAAEIAEIVSEVVEARDVPNEAVDTAQSEIVLREFLMSQQMVWKEMYAQLIRQEYERREQEIEYAQIALMLFEM